jgi:hypothetical protein
MATVDKDFRIKSGLIVEGANATVNGEDIITTGSTTDDLAEGTTNKYYSATQAKSDAADLLTGATLTNITITGDETGLTITAENGVADSTTDDLAEGTTNKYFTDQRALDATASAYDAAGAASAAQTAAENYADSVSTTAYNNAVSYADGLAVNYDPAGSADAAEAAANTYADGVALTAENNAKGYADTVALTAEQSAKSYADSLASNYDAAGSAATAESNANAYTDTAVANLVDGAPALLDTLNELAAAINDDASFASTIATQIGEKQNILTAGDGISIVTDTISVDSTIATKTYVDNAVSTGVGDITSDDVPEGVTNLYFTDQRAVDAIQNTTPQFASVDVTWVRKEEATWTNVATAGTVTAHTFGANKGSVKYLVRVYNGGNSQVSEVLVTTDSSNNIAVLEYGTIYTSVSELATITADWDAANSQYRLRVTTANNASEVLVAATLIAYND